MKNFLAYILGYVAIGIITSCSSDFLEEVPLDSASSANFPNTESEAIQMVTSAYERLGSDRAYGKRGLVALELLGDFAYKGTDRGDGQQLNDIGDFSLLPNNAYLDGWYREMYRGIFRCNAAIESIAAMDESEFKTAGLAERLTGEAYFLRGVYYFHLLRLFGPVPRILKMAETPYDYEDGVAPSSEDDIIDVIISDFNKAIDVLPEVQQEKGRATSGAAKTFLAEAYMWPTSRQDYNSALKLVEEVIASGRYKMHETYLDCFLLSADGGTEDIYSIQNLSTNPSSYSDDNKVGWMIYWGVRFNNIYYDDGFGWLYNYSGFKDLYENGDSIRFNINHWYEDAYDDVYDKVFTYQEGAYGSLLGRSDDPGANFSSLEDLGIRKWGWCVENKASVNSTNSKTVKRNTPKNFPILRYTEVILMRAELLNEVNQGPTPQAYEDINSIRQRAGLADLPGLDYQGFLDAVYHERQIEFVYECKRWWDLARRRTAERYFATVPDKQNFNPVLHYTWPYPTAAVDRNKLLVQKDGW